jgi:hypothetical protein
MIASILFVVFVLEGADVVTTVQVCDATMFNSYSKAGPIIFLKER